MTNTVEQHKVNRTGWPSGPWDQEPDKLNWTDEKTGLPCMIVRNSLGALCGYVAVTRDHPAYGMGYDDVSVDVHGGLTYASRCNHVICHVPEPGASDDVWWLGFDCAHSGDCAPAYPARYHGNHDVYRDMAYVGAEVERLADQLKNMS